MSIILKDPGTAGVPSTPSSLNSVTFNRYSSETMNLMRERVKKWESDVKPWEQAKWDLVDFVQALPYPPMLPENLTLNRLVVPFDLVSRTMMVACCNPFDAAGREAVQQSVDYTVMWYLARPAAIIRSLQNIYRLDSRA